MFKTLTLGILGISIFGWLFLAQAQEEIKVVPIGETIKPEVQKKKRRRYRPPVLKPGTSFLVELGTVLNSGLSQEGEIITLYAAEDVEVRKKAAILLGAPGIGKVTQADKKEKKLTVVFEQIEGYDGGPVSISGTINLQGEDDQASAAVGERFTATVDEKVVINRKKRVKEEPENLLVGFIEIEGKGAELELDEGKSKGKVRMILEAPKGFTADDIVVESVAMTQVNDHELEEPVRPTEKEPKQGDKNKNGTSDWEMYFGTWEFIKNQPKGLNRVYIQGKLKNGRPFQASTRVQIDY